MDDIQLSGKSPSPGLEGGRELPLVSIAKKAEKPVPIKQDEQKRGGKRNPKIKRSKTQKMKE